MRPRVESLKESASRVVLIALFVVCAACGSEGEGPPEPAKAPLRAIVSEWADCFEDEAAIGRVRSVVAEDDPPHDMLVTLESGEQFRVPAGQSTGAIPANDAAQALASECRRP